MKFKLFLLLFLDAAHLLQAQDVQVTFQRPELPVLAGMENNLTGYIRIIKPHHSKMTLTGISYSLSGTSDLQDIERVTFQQCNAYGGGRSGAPAAISRSIEAENSLRLIVPLKSDTSYWAFSVKLSDQADLLHRVNLNCTGVELNGTEQIALNPVYSAGLRVGFPLRVARQDGVNTCRIPGLTTSKKGTLLAIYDARWHSARDLQGDIDIALNRSEDGGRTWLPMQRVLDQKEWGGLPEKFNGVSDACILTDERSGRIFVAGLWMHGVLDRKTGTWIEGLNEESTQWIHQWHARGSQPGVEVKQTSQFLIAYSDDDGKTWSDPMNITAQTKRPEWWLFAPAPGHGITMKDGTLVFPTQGRDHEGKPFSNITYSKDGGKTWVTSNPAYSNTTECMVVELTDGSLMLNMRDNRNYGVKEPNGRRICVTKDLGETWTEHPTSHSVLTESTCMASIHRHDYRQRGRKKSLLAFLNPNSYRSRSHLTLKLSLDDGMTWPEQYWLLLDEWGGYGYSCITTIDDETLGVVYEGSGAQLVFQKIKLSDLIK